MTAIADINIPFNSRRSPVIGTNAVVASDEPLASKIGIDVLQKGGNAADAAVAMAAAISVLEPWAAGPGGDCFCLFYKKSENRVLAINGSGRSAKAVTPELVQRLGFNASNPIPQNHGLAVNVPGAPAAWMDILERFGSKKMSATEIFQPAINLADSGYAVSKLSSYNWLLEEAFLQKQENGEEFLINNHAPKHGQIMKNPNLASTLKKLAVRGVSGFYEGDIAKEIISIIQQEGGIMTLEDLKDHRSTFENPISFDYHGKTIWEMPPNTQGLAVLIALNILSGYDMTKFKHNSSEYIHLLIEVMKIAHSEAFQYICDPHTNAIPTKRFLDPQYGSNKRKLIRPNKSNLFPPTMFPNGQDTSYMTAFDKDGNACSLIFSVYFTFGSLLIPKGCGFVLQNRANTFAMIPNHPNEIGSQKRSYHTIIPGMITDTVSSDFWGCFGGAGGFGQPSFHIQILMNSLHFHMDPQESLDAPRFTIISGDFLKSEPRIYLEEGINQETTEELKAKGHLVKSNCSNFSERKMFCRGHIITRGLLWENYSCKNALWAASDPRADGCAIAI